MLYPVELRDRVFFNIGLEDGSQVLAPPTRLFPFFFPDPTHWLRIQMVYPVELLRRRYGDLATYFRV